jgi:serine/threonine protein kinase
MQIELDEALNWMEAVLDVLKYVHNQDPPILHRDIKPPNLMLTKSGDILLVDFGIARTLEATSYTHIGTPGFASLDHYTGNFSPSSDIFSLGATFHYLLTGSNPRSRKEFDFPPISDFRDNIPPEIDKIFRKMLELKPKNRYQNAEEVIEDIEKFRRKNSPKESQEEEISGVIGEEHAKKGKIDEEQTMEKVKAVEPKPASIPVKSSPPAGQAKPSGVLYVIFVILLIIISLGAYFLGKNAANKPENRSSPTPSISSPVYFFDKIERCPDFRNFVCRKIRVFR